MDAIGADERIANGVLGALDSEVVFPVILIAANTVGAQMKRVGLFGAHRFHQDPMQIAPVKHEIRIAVARHRFRAEIE